MTKKKNVKKHHAHSNYNSPKKYHSGKTCDKQNLREKLSSAESVTEKNKSGKKDEASSLQDDQRKSIEKKIQKGKKIRQKQKRKKDGKKAERIKKSQTEKKISKKINSSGNSKNKKNFSWFLIMIALVLLAVFTVLGIYKLHKQNSREHAMEIMQEARARRKEKEKNAYLRFLEGTKEKRKAEQCLQDAWEELWLKEIEITAENADTFATIENCVISDENSSVIEVNGTIPGIPESDSDDLYLFAMNTYETSLNEDAKPVATYRINRAKGSFQFKTNMNYKAANSNLFKKFVVAMKKDGKYTILSKSRYITNPERMAKFNVYKEVDSVKGLLVSPHRLNTGELEDLGIRQAIYNIPLSKITGQTTSGNYPTISYTYNGRTYSIDGQAVAEYDIIFGTLSKKGIRVTAVLLNDMNHEYPELVHPEARSGSTAPYVMLNAEEEAGINCMAAVATFLAERYSGNGHGLISNWIVANEINARKEWNYMAYTDVHSYTKAYAQAFRVLYNAIKSVNGSAMVYMPLDQTWNRNLKGSTDYDARDVIDEFNAIIKERGNIDWQLAYHPYPVPLTNAAFWNTGNYFRKLTTDSVDTAMVCMKNIHVVTDYMKREELLTEEGNSRKVLLSEQGFTSSSGEAVQAAAIAYAYFICENNSQINGFLLNRQIDSGEEVSQGLAFGLLNAGGGRKQAYEVYKKMGTPEEKDAAEFAKGIIGIGSWSDVIKQR